MSEKKPMPKCPYCGWKMQPHFDYPRMKYSDVQFYCNSCGAMSPLARGYQCSAESSENALKEAYEKAMRRYEEPNRVLTMEEVTADTEKEDWSFMWIERKYDEKYALQYCGWYATDTWVILVLPADEKKIYELKSDYGKTWRCWLRKPTLEEMAETPWGAKHNEH